LDEALKTTAGAGPARPDKNSRSESDPSRHVKSFKYKGARSMNRGYCGIGIEHTKEYQNVGTLFRSAFIFEADFIFTVGRRYQKQHSDTVKSYKHLPLFHFDCLEDLYRHLPYGCQLVGIELDERAYPLKNFIHPERACYLLGAEDHGLTKKALEMCHSIIQLPGRTCLNVSVAGSIVLYDRFNKSA
jgi:tRNA G18 (ribose-2'-O)-methylase SpoU